MTSPDIENTFDAYIDGLLEGERLALFEEALRSDQRLRDRVELHLRIDDSIRCLFTPETAASSIPEAAIKKRSRRFTRRTEWTIAASVGLIVIGAAVTVYFTNLSSKGGAGKVALGRAVLIEPIALYRQLEAASFTPDWVCGDEQEFIAYTADKFGEPFLIEETQGLAFSGWTVTQALSYYTGALMARSNDADIVLLVDRASVDRKLTIPKNTGLRIFRRKIGGLVLYEITPGDKPLMLPRVYLPEIPESSGQD